MTLYLPDTNVLIYALAGQKPYGQHLIEWIEKKILRLSAIVAAEFLVGATDDEAKRFELLLATFESLPVDTMVARIAADYRKAFANKGYNLKLPDCLIAATAKLHKTTLVSFNRGDFPMDDITILTL